MRYVNKQSRVWIPREVKWEIVVRSSVYQERLKLPDSKTELIVIVEGIRVRVVDEKGRVGVGKLKEGAPKDLEGVLKDIEGDLGVGRGREVRVWRNRTGNSKGLTVQDMRGWRPRVISDTGTRKWIPGGFYIYFALFHSLSLSVSLFCILDTRWLPRWESAYLQIYSYPCFCSAMCNLICWV